MNMYIKKYLPEKPKDFIWGIIAGVAITLISTYLISEFILEDKKPDDSWKLIKVSLDNYIEEFDRGFIKGLDSVRNEMSRRIGLESGASIPPQLDYCISKRMERDNTIDSLIIQFALHGGDTTTLHIKRKLPINVRSITKQRDMDHESHYKGVILDTL